jgi:hypothetical protein
VRHEPHGNYNAEHDRLDYFVSAKEVASAYEMLTKHLSDARLSSKTPPITLLGSLIVHLVCK